MNRFLLSALLLTFTQSVHAQQPYKLVPIEKQVKKVEQMQPDSTLHSLSNNPEGIVAKQAIKVIKEVPLAHNLDYFGKDHSYVINYTQKYLASHTSLLMRVKNTGKRKFTVIDAALKRHSVPTELRYLAVIESALNPQAVSPVGAVGTWQFMEATGRMFGLTVNGTRDDRTDLAKSSNAAARYLKYLYAKLNDWLLVVAAYNSGPTPVLRAINKTGSKNFFVIKKYLPRETQGHVMAFIATGTILEKLQHFLPKGKFPPGFFHPESADTVLMAEAPKPKFTPEELAMMSIIKMKDPILLDMIASELSIDKELLTRWNEDYELFEDRNYGEPTYSFRIPKDKVDSYFEKRDILQRRSEAYFAELSM